MNNMTKKTQNQMEEKIKELVRDFAREIEVGNIDSKLLLNSWKRDLEKDLISLFSQQKEQWITELEEKLEEYKCDFNWDFEKNKEKHKSYIAFDDVIKKLKEGK